ncbi:MAG: hypothetical protein WKF51_00710 [Geodermatophilaceae bacterium]
MSRAALQPGQVQPPADNARRSHPYPSLLPYCNPSDTAGRRREPTKDPDSSLLPHLLPLRPPATTSQPGFSR